MRKFLLAVCFLSIACASSAQYKWEYGLHLGASNYLGDIGGQEMTRRTSILDMHINETKFSAGLYTRYKLSKKLAIHTSLNWVPVEDRDSNSTNPARRARNLNFKNNIWELSTRAELTIFYDNDVGNRGYYNPEFKLIAFAGLGLFYHNPKGQILTNGVEQYDGEWFDLREWRTEGQSKEYSKINLSVPFGLGFYFTSNKIWRFGLDISYRYTFTDYIDDISTEYANPDFFFEELGGDEGKLAAEFASQSYQGLINEIDDPDAGSIYDHRWNPGDDERGGTKRGDPTHNDNYITAVVSVGKVIKGRSKFYKKKYSWLKQRAAARRSRAKFNVNF